jgi:outer membrane protein OmpA-like peptidoglycan-associated protein
MYQFNLRSVCQILTALLAVSLPIGLAAQGTSPTMASSSESPSRWDIFAGYSYLAPKGTVQVPQANGTTVGYSYDAVNVGGLFSGAYWFDKFVGAQLEYGVHEWGISSGNGNPVGTHGNDDGFQTIAGGIIFRFPQEHYTPFIHGLVGGAVVNGPDFNQNKWGPDLTAGGGMDYDLPWLDHRFALRVFQADYEYMHANFGPQFSPPGGRANINAARLSAGIVIHAGTIEPPAPVTLACTANPQEVFPGDPVTVTASAGQLNPKENVIYTWSGSGVTGNGTTATVVTGPLAPGSYTVQGNVKEGRPGKEGEKPWQTANCSASVTVKAFEPPTISCSANPSTIKPGDTSAITATGVSPQNRPLTYSYSTAAGSVSGTGTSATYNSAGAPAGSVDVTCSVSDDKGHSASSTATVAIVAPPPPAPSPEQTRLEARLALHSIFFATAQPTEKNPEGGLAESQQGTLTTLATDFKNYLNFKPDARLTLTGHADPRGGAKYNQALTERRVNRAKEFLVQQGVPEASIDTRALGEEQQLTADQVKALVEQNPDLTDEQRAQVLRQMNTIVLAQNRRVDITLSTTGQQSVQLYPFNAADASTLLSKSAPAPRKKSKAKP